MNLVINPPKKEWSDILQRPVFDAKGAGSIERHSGKGRSGC
jgi:hypothetical protein